MANPWVIVPIAVVFVAMAASMFGAFELNLPPALAAAAVVRRRQGLRRRVRHGPGRRHHRRAVHRPELVVGADASSPPRARSPSAARLLFTYALGMGVLFFAIAAFAIALPKSGAWMEAVKSIFGIVMLVAALYFLRNVVPALMHYGRPTPRFLAINASIALAGLALGAIHLSFHDGARQASRARPWPSRSLVAGLFGGIALGADAEAAGVDLRRKGRRRRGASRAQAGAARLLRRLVHPVQRDGRQDLRPRSPTSCSAFSWSRSTAPTTTIRWWSRRSSATTRRRGRPSSSSTATASWSRSTTAWSAPTICAPFFRRRTSEDQRDQRDHQRAADVERRARQQPAVDAAGRRPDARAGDEHGEAGDEAAAQQRARGGGDGDQAMAPATRSASST